MGLFNRGPSLALVVREGAIELLAMQGKKVAASTRVAMSGAQGAGLPDAIRQALASAGQKAPQRVMVAVQTQAVLFRSFMLPALPRQEWEPTIRFEVRKYLPFKLTDLVWGYHVNGSRPTQGTAGVSPSGQLEVAFAGIQRGTFEQVESAVRAAGLLPVVIEAQSLSLARLLDAPKKGQTANDFVCMVEIAGDWAHLAIVRDRTPYLTRDINLMAPAAATEPAGSGTATTDPSIQRLSSELSVSIDFFTREHPAAQIQRVVLFGEEELIDPWIPELAVGLRCPVESGRRLLAPHVRDACALSFASAVGLLREQDRASQASLDFLKRSVQEKEKADSAVAKASIIKPASNWLRDFEVRQLAPAGLLGVVLVAGMWFLGHLHVMSADGRLKALVRKRPVVGFGLDGKSQEALKPIQGMAQAQLTALHQLIDGRIRVAEKLDALVRTLPEGVWLTNLTFEETPGQPNQFRMIVKGACYLGDTERELSAIQTLEEGIKSNPTLFKGFAAARVGEINAQDEPRSQVAYRTFQLYCDSERRL